MQNTLNAMQNTLNAMQNTLNAMQNRFALKQQRRKFNTFDVEQLSKHFQNG
jgi:hypothetical protein